MFRARGSPPRRPLPDDVYAELVDIIFRSMSPLINMGVVAAGVGALLYSMTHDFAVAALAAVSLLIMLGRVGLNLAYHRRRSGLPLALAEVKRWELAFGTGSLIAAVALGLLNARALIVGGVAEQLLVTGMMFGYCAGAVIRLSVRPALVAISVPAVMLLTFAGFAVHYANSEGLYGGAYVGLGLLVAMFSLGTVEMVNHLYRTTLEQLTTKSMLSHLARKDELTGLSNRLSLRERFDQDMIKVRRSGDFIALHFVDLDRFKAVNDNHGHPVGDALLKMVAGRLTRALRDGDTAARLGGDEFVILQTNIDGPREAEILAKRIVREISKPYSIDGHELSIGASVGVAMAPQEGIDLDDLAARADAALYRAKTTKRGTIGFWKEPQLLARGAA
jgi:diguanylate cyclase (GGDEF)-like protein